MRVLIVGFGSVAQKHYDALLQIDPSTQVIALRNNPGSEQKQNVQSVFSLEEARLYMPFDFAIISNPTYKHKETIELLLDLNCSLFIEKPLFHTIQSGQLINKLSKYRIITYVACNLRFLDSIKYVKEKLLPHIRINEVNVYCGSFLPEWRQTADYRSVYSASPDQGGGVHLDLIHELDYVYWFFGPPVYVHSYKRNRSSLEIEAIDYANFLLEYDKFAVNILLNYYRRDKKRSIEIVASDETYSIDLYSNSVSSTKGLLFKSEQTILDTYKKQLEYFVGKIKNKKGEIIMNSIKEAFEVLKICLTYDINR